VRRRKWRGARSALNRAAHGILDQFIEMLKEDQRLYDFEVPFARAFSAAEPGLVGQHGITRRHYKEYRELAWGRMDLYLRLHESNDEDRSRNNTVDEKFVRAASWLKELLNRWETEATVARDADEC
jgi:hypothetical protein